MRFLTFDTLITPSIIRFLFYCCIALSCIGAVFGYGAISFYSSQMGGSGGGLLALILAIVVAAVGILLSRIAAEMILVVFMIRDELAWQRLNKPGSLNQAAAE